MLHSILCTTFITSRNWFQSGNHRYLIHFDKYINESKNFFRKFRSLKKNFYVVVEHAHVVCSLKKKITRIRTGLGIMHELCLVGEWNCHTCVIVSKYIPRYDENTSKILLYEYFSFLLYTLTSNRWTRPMAIPKNTFFWTGKYSKWSNIRLFRFKNFPSFLLLVFSTFLRITNPYQWFLLSATYLLTLSGGHWLINESTKSTRNVGIKKKKV